MEASAAFDPARAIDTEAIAIAVLFYGLLIYFTIGKYAVPFHAEYGSTLSFMGSALPVRGILPWVGPLMAVTLVAIILALGMFAFEWLKPDEKYLLYAWSLSTFSQYRDVIAEVFKTATRT